MMSIFDFLEDSYGKQGCFDFIKGIWDWQDNYIFIESLNSHGEFFLSIINDRSIVEMSRYLIEEDIYKGLICSLSSLKNIKNSSFTLNKEIAYDFAKTETGRCFGEGHEELHRVVVKTSSLGVDISEITKDAILWLKNNIEPAYRHIGINVSAISEEEAHKEFDSWFADYEVEEEVISSFTIDDIEIEWQEELSFTEKESMMI